MIHMRKISHIQETINLRIINILNNQKLYYIIIKVIRMSMKAFVIVFITAFIFAHTFIKYQHSCTCLSDFIFPGMTIDFDNDESKLFLVRNIVLKLALIIFVHVILVIVLRIANRTISPGTKPDPAAVRLVNKIMANTIEQSVVFLGLYVYFIFDGPYQKFSSIQLLNLPTWFLFGRVMFSLGYIIGALIDIQQLRAYGFAINVAASCLLVEQIFLPIQPITNFLFT